MSNGVAATANSRVPVPRDRENDYTLHAANERQAFVHERTGVELQNVGSFSFDPAIITGNIEQFIGVAQVPIGLAGPLLVHGEHAQGEFYVPLATAEGTLVASYNRGMRLLYESGGVTTTIVADHMQRAPAFLFASAREARAFGDWLDEHFAEIKAAAEATTRSGKLVEIEKYTASRILYGPVPPSRGQTDRKVDGSPLSVRPFIGDRDLTDADVAAQEPGGVQPRGRRGRQARPPGLRAERVRAPDRA